MDMSDARILAVDDHPDVRRVVASYLSIAGYRVDTACDGIEATEMLEAGPFDLVITDLKMPRMDGLALLKHVRARYPRTDVMMISGHATIESAVEATKLGARNYFTKPFNISDFQIKIRNWAEARALRQETERLGAVVSLTRLSHTLTRNLDLESLSEQIIALVEDTFDSQYGSLMLVETLGNGCGSEARLSLLSTTSGSVRPDWLVRQVLDCVVKRRQPWTDRGPLDGSSMAGRVSAISIPLCQRDTVIGVLNVARGPGETPYSADEVQLLTVFGSQIAIALENARAYRELKDLSIGTITALVTAVEARDPYTKGHSERVARYAVALAKELGLPPQETEDLRVAGLLHDIGKVGVSDLILNKPGGLTAAEYEEVKRHPRVGASIVEGIKPLHRIVPLIYHHHERYDGGGYPDGLGGDDIPLGARILAVADTYEAMTSSRAYRSSMDAEDSLDLLRGGAGGQLEPGLVDALHRLWVSGRLRATADAEKRKEPNEVRS